MKIFERRNRLLLKAANFPLGKEGKKCCGEIVDTKHIYNYQKWSEENEKPSYEMMKLYSQIICHTHESIQ